MAGARRRGSVPRPTRRGVGAVFVLGALVVLAVTSGTGELIPLIVAVAVPLLAAPVSAWRRAGQGRARLSVTAAAPPMSVVGGAAILEIGVTNHTGRGAPALCFAVPVTRWRRRPPGPAPGTPSFSAPTKEKRQGRWLVPSALEPVGPCPPGRVVGFSSPVPSARRGVFTLRLGQAWVLDPFGLFGAAGPVVAPVTVTLYPPADGPGPTPVAPRLGSMAATARPVTGTGRDGSGDLVGIRPYVAGDRLSLLHWPARARTGAWFVRQFAPEGADTRRLVLDDRAGVHRQADFEAMLARAHAMVLALGDAGRTVELCTMSGTVRLVAPVPAGLEQARLVLATVLPRDPTDAGGVGRGGAGRDGTVLTTATGARSLPDDVERIVVGT
ncbi:MAG: DUF58 domain-containing protein [Acidimicrobiales bacterium]